MTEALHGGPAADERPPRTTLPKVSVVIPTHNRALLLRETLSSVLAQRGVDLQIVVVDDGSTDETSSFLGSLSDHRVQVVRHRSPLGVSTARNAGVALCEAAWIAFTDDDDLWAPDKLVAQLRAMEADPGAFWSFVGVVNVDHRLRIIGWTEAPACSNIAVQMLADDIVPGGGSGVLVSKELLRAASAFDPGLSCLADWDMWLRLAQNSPVASVNRPLLAHRVHRGAMSLDVDRCDREFEIICNKYADLRAAANVVPDRINHARWKSATYLRAGQRTRSLQALRTIPRSGTASRKLGRSAFLAVLPEAIRLRDYRESRKVPPDWRSEAESWVAPLR